MKALAISDPPPKTLTVREWIAATGRRPRLLHCASARSKGWAYHVYCDSYKGRRCAQSGWEELPMVKVKRRRVDGSYNQIERLRESLFTVVK